MNKREAAEKYALNADGISEFPSSEYNDRLNEAFLAGWDGGYSEGYARAIEAAAKVAEECGYHHEAPTSVATRKRVADEIRKLAD